MVDIKQDSPEAPLNAPIPGQSLTAPLGDRPWQKPARYSNPDEALAFYVERITKPKRANELLDILENGVAVDTLVDILQQGGVMEGIHSLDVGIIIAPALTEVISNMAEASEVEYTKMSISEDEKIATTGEIAFALKEEPQAKIVEMDVEEEVEQEEPKGLMARRAM
jgi:hypothetical protein|tara:strand:+ start:380 stop:880 length:501 start_codon:yes stop_codon:yes gene_type:complete